MLVMINPLIMVTELERLEVAYIRRCMVKVVDVATEVKDATYSISSISSNLNTFKTASSGCIKSKI